MKKVIIKLLSLQGFGRQGWLLSEQKRYLKGRECSRIAFHFYGQIWWI